MPYYVVQGITEEFQCCECGWPVYNGDKAFETENDVFCTKKCALRSYKRDCGIEV